MQLNGMGPGRPKGLAAALAAMLAQGGGGGGPVERFFPEDMPVQQGGAPPWGDQQVGQKQRPMGFELAGPPQDKPMLGVEDSGMEAPQFAPPPMNLRMLPKRTRSKMPGSSNLDALRRRFIEMAMAGGVRGR